MKRFWMLALLMCGCGPTKYEQTLSQINVIARKEFNEQNFLNEGKTNEFDLWGNEIIWEMNKGIWNYGLYVRSPGPDKLPYTRDDIQTCMLIPIRKDKEDEGVSERFIRGMSRGFTKGIKQGFQEEKK